jgi:hypothetical protein
MGIPLRHTGYEVRMGYPCEQISNLNIQISMKSQIPILNGGSNPECSAMSQLASSNEDSGCHSRLRQVLAEFA